jgi:hypothetical protein
LLPCGEQRAELAKQCRGDQAAKVDALKKACPDFARMRSLVMSFRGILQSGKVATLARWMKKAVASGIYGMKRFARKLNHDLAAVKNALRESWSNGPVKVHTNRLKMLKRQIQARPGNPVCGCVSSRRKKEIPHLQMCGRNYLECRGMSMKSWFCTGICRIVRETLAQTRLTEKGRARYASSHISVVIQSKKFINREQCCSEAGSNPTLPTCTH